VSGHYVEWDDETLRFHCEAPPESECHSVWSCDCEIGYNIRRDPDTGAWLHDALDDYDNRVEATHGSEQDPTHCGPALFIDDALVTDCGPDLWLYDDDDEPVPPFLHDVDVEWDSEGYGYRWTFTALAAPGH
jgi:hypothetical protein